MTTSPELSRRAAAALNTPLGRMMARSRRWELVAALGRAENFEDLAAEDRWLIEQMERSAPT